MHFYSCCKGWQIIFIILKCNRIELIVKTMTTFKKDEPAGISDSRFNHDIYSRVVRAGKRTYFFDVKSTRGDEYYLTITESKRKLEDGGGPVFEKHKIFLYREDFSRFIDTLHEVFEFIGKSQPPASEDEKDKSAVEDFSCRSIDFEDLPG